MKAEGGSMLGCLRVCGKPGWQEQEQSEWSGREACREGPFMWDLAGVVRTLGFTPGGMGSGQRVSASE